MSTFDNPNREAVGLEPIWAGAGVEPEVDPIVEEPKLKVELEPELDDDEEELLA